MIGTQPDISYTVTQLAQQSANPSKQHLEKALYCMSADTYLALLIACSFMMVNLARHPCMHRL